MDLVNRSQMSYSYQKFEDRPFDMLPSIELNQIYNSSFDSPSYSTERQVIGDKIDSEEIEVSLQKSPPRDSFQCPTANEECFFRVKEVPLTRPKKVAANPRTKFLKVKVWSPGIQGVKPEQRQQRDSDQST